MLDYAWIIPAIPALSFVLILFFGKKLPKHGSEIGITALAISFVLACVTAVQWIQHVNDAEGKSAGRRAARRSARASSRTAAITRPWSSR